MHLKKEAERINTGKDNKIISIEQPRSQVVTVSRKSRDSNRLLNNNTNWNGLFSASQGQEFDECLLMSRKKDSGLKGDIRVPPVHVSEDFNGSSKLKNKVKAAEMYSHETVSYQPKCP